MTVPGLCRRNRQSDTREPSSRLLSVLGEREISKLYRSLWSVIPSDACLAAPFMLISTRYMYMYMHIYFNKTANGLKSCFRALNK